MGGRVPIGVNLRDDRRWIVSFARGESPAETPPPGPLPLAGESLTGERRLTSDETVLWWGRWLASAQRSDTPWCHEPVGESDREPLRAPHLVSRPIGA